MAKATEFVGVNNDEKQQQQTEAEKTQHGRTRTTAVIYHESEEDHHGQQQHQQHLMLRITRDLSSSSSEEEREEELNVKLEEELEELEEEEESIVEAYEHTQEYFDHLESDGSCFFPNLDDTHALAAKWEAYPDLEALPKPVINLGMPKCGSTSMYHFFSCGGYRASHYFCNNFNLKCGSCMLWAAQQGYPVLDTCGNYDVLTQIDTEGNAMCIFPQVNLLEDIHHNAPNATFILPFRNIDHWIRSIKAWHDTKQHPLLNEVLKGCHIDPILPVGEGGTDEQLRQFICHHVTRVREFVAAHPSHTLVELNIEGAYTGEVLSSLFRIDPKCWKHINANPEFQT